MFNDASFRQITLPVSVDGNDYVMHIKRKYADLDGNKRTCGPRWEEIE